MIFTLRQFVSPMAIKVYAIFILGLLIKSNVSIIDVWSNAASSGGVSYMLYAFEHTRTLVQVATLGVLAGSLWFVWDFLRNLLPHKQSYN